MSHRRSRGIDRTNGVEERPGLSHWVFSVRAGVAPSQLGLRGLALWCRPRSLCPGFGFTEKCPAKGRGGRGRCPSRAHGLRDPQKVAGLAGRGRQASRPAIPGTAVWGGVRPPANSGFVLSLHAGLTPVPAPIPLPPPHKRVNSEQMDRHPASRSLHVLTRISLTLPNG